MTDTIARLMTQLQVDPWRTQHGFSADMAGVANKLVEPGLPDEQLKAHLEAWLQRSQPCLFGRLAAKHGMITYCFLRASDLQRDDEFIRTKIQAARSEWTREAFDGRRSGFVIVATSPELALAVPSAAVRQIAQRICSLYLLRDAPMDTVLHDEIFLEKPGAARTTWKWQVGVNYFSAHGDGRWWHDHRFPAGVAFSMNSVGHMAKAGLLAKGLAALDELLGEEAQELPRTKIDSLDQALEFAMRTIHLASEANSGKATKLLPLPEGSQATTRQCPVQLPSFLQNKNYCEYAGYYHTDHTLPSEFFTENVQRLPNAQEHVLDFTYLFDRSLENPDFVTMGVGRRIRSSGSAPRDSGPTGTAAVRPVARVTPDIVDIAASARLVRALARRDSQ